MYHNIKSDAACNQHRYICAGSNTAGTLEQQENLALTNTECPVANDGFYTESENNQVLIGGWLR